MQNCPFLKIERSSTRERLLTNILVTVFWDWIISWRGKCCRDVNLRRSKISRLSIMHYTPGPPSTLPPNVKSPTSLPPSTPFRCKQTDIFSFYYDSKQRSKLNWATLQLPCRLEEYASLRNWHGWLREAQRNTVEPLDKNHLEDRGIKQFREKLSEKVQRKVPKGIVGGFEFTVLKVNLEE